MYKIRTFASNRQGFCRKKRYGHDNLPVQFGCRPAAQQGLAGGPAGYLESGDLAGARSHQGGARIGKITWAQAGYNRNARISDFDAPPSPLIRMPGRKRPEKTISIGIHNGDVMPLHPGLKFWRRIRYHPHPPETLNYSTCEPLAAIHARGTATGRL